MEVKLNSFSGIRNRFLLMNEEYKKKYVVNIEESLI